MAYGILAQNSSGETVIQDNLPQYIETRSGTLYTSFTANNMYYHKILNTIADPTGSEQTMYKLPVGGWVSYFPFGIPGTAGIAQGADSGAWPNQQIITNQQYLDFAVFDSITNVGASSDTYGMRVYNSSSALCYDSGRATAWVSYGNSFYIDNTFTQSVTVNSTGNCVSTRAPWAHSSGNDIYGFAARRVSTTQWVFEKRIVDYTVYGHHWYSGIAYLLLTDINCNAMIGHA